VAIIMDGNGRWAQGRGKLRWEGHAEGARAVRRALEATGNLGIPYLTLYAFSVNNWNRPRIEVEALMRLLTRFARKEQAELIQKGVRVQVVGTLDDLPSGPRRAVEHLVEATAGGTRTTLSLALSYGGRCDLTRAARRLAEQVALGQLRPEEVSETLLRQQLSTSDLPDVDLLIRTGGESRVSDFLLFEAAYAELAFLPVMWPEFDEAHLQAAVARYQGIERRFGLTGEQITGGPTKRD
jgi:undecaprenyl diphosphate synthase